MNQAPKTRGISYVPLGRIISKGAYKIGKIEVKIIQNKLYTDGREVNSFLLKDDNYVIIKAQHFTSREAASNIRVYRRFVPVSEDDNYAYFIEDGFYDLSQEEIKKTSGARNAEVKFTVEFTTPFEFVWIKVEKNHPVKFAIEKGIMPEEIIEITLERVSL